MLATALLVSLLSTQATAPTTPPEPEPFLARYAATRGFRAGAPIRPVLTPDGGAVLFLRSGPRDAVQALLETDLASGTTRELARAETLLAGASGALTAAEQAQLERMRITARGITRFALSRDGRQVLVTVGGKLFLLERRTGAVRAVVTRGRPLSPILSPDGSRIAYVLDRDLYVQDLATGAERALTHAGEDGISFGTAEFAAEEELDRFEGFWWSPDSRALAYQETDEREVEQFTIHDPLHPERPADTFRYPRAGKANARVRVGVVAASGGETTWLAWDRERFPYLASVTWSAHAPLSLVVLDRKQQEQVLLAADPATGATRPLVAERDPAWVNAVPGFPRWSADGRSFLWRTERHGAPELEVRRADGTLERSAVGPGAGLAALVGWDEAGDRIWFTGGSDPTQTRLYVTSTRLHLAGQGARTAEWRPDPDPVSLSALLSLDGRVLLVTRQTFTGIEPPTAWSSDGRRLVQLPSIAEPVPFATRAELRKVGPGAGLHTKLIRPRAAVRGARLPVLVEVYGGPHAQLVQVGPDPMGQWLADQGFLVVSVDGRGTPRRGRDFERAIRGDFAGPVLEDQVTGLTALAAEVPELDLTRVGVHGWSFGGYLAALAVLRRPDVFHVAVAGAPVTEWREYDTAYTERYLGLPQEDPAAYDRSSLLPLAPRLERPLLLVHGTADDNVYFFHSLELSDALLRAGRRCELLPLPGLTHLAMREASPELAERIWGRMIGFLREGLAHPAAPPSAPAP